MIKKLVNKKVNTYYAFWITLAVVFSLVSCKAFKSEKNWTMISPDKKLRVELVLDNAQKPIYSAYCNNIPVIKPSGLGISLDSDDQSFMHDLEFVRSTERTVNETYNVVSGKRKHCAYTANENSLTFRNAAGNLMDIIFRVSNHGVAFRYQLYNKNESPVKEELSEFSIDKNSIAWIQSFKAPFNDYEMFYTKRQLDTMRMPEYYIPGLFHTPDNIWVFISDASVNGDYAACQLFHKGDGLLTIKLPDQTFELEEWMKNENYWYEMVHAESPQIIAHVNLLTPWRAMIISDNIGDIVESNLIENLSNPSKIKDESWIEPGVAVFPWWGNTTANDEPEVLKDYIDLAAEMNWDYIEFDIGLIGNNGGYAADFWKNVNYIPEIINYAKSKGIKVYGWDERRNLNTREKRDKLFAKYRELGISGIKMDFINSDKQEAMKWYDEATQQAAEYKLLVSFHGSITPRGFRRTFPNIMAYEGVRGAERYKSIMHDDAPNPEFNCTLPFTRNVSGPMDYTPVTFSTPKRSTTYAHELALPFIFESGWMVMADNPEEFRKCKAGKLLQNVHADWDEIKFIDGFPGEFCCLARRNKNDWFVAAINSGTKREIEVNFDFLDEGDYNATIYTDDGQDNLTISDLNISPNSSEKFNLIKNGGFVIHIESNKINR